MSTITILPSGHNVTVSQGGSSGLVIVNESGISPSIVTINQGQQGPAGVSIYYVDNYGDNRILTSDGNPSGLYAESDLTFDGYKLRVSGIEVSLSGHNHTSSNITNFNSSVSGLLPSVTGTGYVSVSFSSNKYTIEVLGLQPSGSYASGIHTHSTSDIVGLSGYVSSGVGSYLNLLSNVSDECDVKYILVQDISNNTHLVSISGIAQAISVIDGGGVSYSGC